MNDNPYRQIPSVAKLLVHPALAAVQQRVPVSLLTESIRAELDAARVAMADFNLDDLLTRIARRATDAQRLRYCPVINATGIVLHTNLGRAPMAESAAQAAYNAARGYLALELDLATGERSSRQNPIRAAVARLTGADSATVVNNCAAATVIALRTLAAGKEVIVSRGQLIEIGGSFRIPEIMTVSGATLREVGTTNITRLRDYEAAIGPNTAALMRVHCSNYRVRGFTESVSIEDLATLGAKHGIPVIDDVGSGSVFAFESEPTIAAGIAAGADLTLFSGDKLFGGPQCGIIAGRQKWIEAIERNPFMRAVRCDKMTLAALEATLALYRDQPLDSIPTLRMLALPLAELRRRSETFAERLRSLPGVTVEVRDDESFAGGGSLPDQAFPTVVIAVCVEGMAESLLATRLRTGTPAVMARIKEGLVCFDLRTVFVEQQDELFAATKSAIE